MAFQTTENMIWNFPKWTILIAMISIAVFMLPDLSSILIYKRSAIIDGETWRILTAAFVHFSPTHLFYNLTGFLLCGLVLEIRKYPYVLLLYCISIVSMGLAVYVLLPEMEYYAGISGVVHGSIYYLALMLLKEPGMRLLSIIVLIVIPVKIFIESHQFYTLSFYDQDNSFVPVPLVHIIGLLVAVSLYLYGHLNKSYTKQLGN